MHISSAKLTKNLVWSPSINLFASGQVQDYLSPEELIRARKYAYSGSNLVDS